METLIPFQAPVNHVVTPTQEKRIRKFSWEQKRIIIREAFGGTTSLKTYCRLHGLDASTVRKWKKQFFAIGSQKRHPDATIPDIAPGNIEPVAASLKTENGRLRAENQRLKELVVQLLLQQQQEGKPGAHHALPVP